jgi:predicted permease
LGAALEVILPVFLLLGFGYTAVWRGLFEERQVDGLMRFVQVFAIPALLFRGISTLDIQTLVDGRLMLSFYAGATLGFIAGILGARFLFGRSWENAVAIGFCCLFSNSLLLGLPITERAYGADALAANYALIAIHAPYCYILGIATMEVVQARGTGLGFGMIRRIFKAIFNNAMIIGILLGLFVNLTKLPLPGVLVEAVDLLVRAALPTALFGLGCVLFRYRPEGDLRVMAFVSLISLGLHPLVTYTLAQTLELGTDALRSAVVTASVAPGINAYVFANMYGTAKRVAATSVLLTTALTVLTTPIWLALLP